MLRLLVDLASSDDLVVAGASCGFSVNVELAKDMNDGVAENLDQALSQQVGLTIEKSKQVANVSVDGTRHPL